MVFLATSEPLNHRPDIVQIRTRSSIGDLVVAEHNLCRQAWQAGFSDFEVMTRFDPPSATRSLVAGSLCPLVAFSRAGDAVPGSQLAAAWGKIIALRAGSHLPPRAYALYVISAVLWGEISAGNRPSSDPQKAVDRPRRQDSTRSADAGHVDLGAIKGGRPTPPNQRQRDVV